MASLLVLDHRWFSAGKCEMPGLSRAYMGLVGVSCKGYSKTRVVQVWSVIA
jgi:hypothetical protein